MVRHTVALRPVAFQKLQNLTEELSRQAGWKLSMAQVVEMAIDYIEKLEAMKDEDDEVGYKEKEEQQRRDYMRGDKQPTKHTDLTNTTITVDKQPTKHTDLTNTTITVDKQPTKHTDLTNTTITVKKQPL